jgi:hypothetical protein
LINCTGLAGGFEVRQGKGWKSMAEDLVVIWFDYEYGDYLEWPVWNWFGEVRPGMGTGFVIWNEEELW